MFVCGTPIGTGFEKSGLSFGAPFSPLGGSPARKRSARWTSASSSRSKARPAAACTPRSATRRCCGWAEARRPQRPDRPSCRLTNRWPSSAGSGSAGQTGRLWRCCCWWSAGGWMRPGWLRPTSWPTASASSGRRRWMRRKGRCWGRRRWWWSRWWCSESCRRKTGRWSRLKCKFKTRLIQLFVHDHYTLDFN